ncbi:hypothetical protein ABIA16_003732 [Sinorhizobium fredii]
MWRVSGAMTSDGQELLSDELSKFLPALAQLPEG